MENPNWNTSKNNRLNSFDGYFKPIETLKINKNSPC